jgi:hypothetical protein
LFFAVVRFSPPSQETEAVKRKAEAKNIRRIRKSRSLIFWLRPKGEARGRAVLIRGVNIGKIFRQFSIKNADTYLKSKQGYAWWNVGLVR